MHSKSEDVFGWAPVPARSRFNSLIFSSRRWRGVGEVSLKEISQMRDKPSLDINQSEPRGLGAWAKHRNPLGEVLGVGEEGGEGLF